MFVAYHQPSMIEQPADAAFDFVTPSVSSECASVLCLPFHTVAAVRADQLDFASLQSFSQRIAVSRLVVDQSLGSLRQQLPIQERFDAVDFGGRGTADVGGQGESLSINQEHELRSLATLGLAHVGAPFFAGQNVPSPNASCQTIICRWSKCSKRRFQASKKMPASVQSWCRRQQVLGDGKCVGKSFQRAPVRSTHKIPSRQARASIGGRPPLDDITCSGNKSAIRSHCSSESCGCGSVLDPVTFRPTPGRETRVVVMMRPPFKSLHHATFVPHRSVF